MLPELVTNSPEMVVALWEMPLGLRSTLANPKSRIFTWPRLVEDVCRLDVAVRDSLVVCSVQRVGNLDADIQYSFNFQPVALDQMPERLPFQQFHCNEGSPVGLVDRVSRLDVRFAVELLRLRLPRHPGHCRAQPTRFHDGYLFHGHVHVWSFFRPASHRQTERHPCASRRDTHRLLLGNRSFPRHGSPASHAHHPRSQYGSRFRPLHGFAHQSTADIAKRESAAHVTTAPAS